MVSLDLVVLRCPSIEATAAFYSALGLVLVHEQHGRGQAHLAATLGSIVLELYPGDAGGPARLGFTVDDVVGTAAALTAAGFTVESSVATDPDGRRVALSGRLDP